MKRFQILALWTGMLSVLVWSSEPSFVPMDVEGLMKEHMNFLMKKEQERRNELEKNLEELKEQEYEIKTQVIKAEQDLLSIDQKLDLISYDESDPAAPSKDTIELVHQRKEREKLKIQKMQYEQSLKELMKKEYEIKTQVIKAEMDLNNLMEQEANLKIIRAKMDLEELMEKEEDIQEKKEDAQHRLAVMEELELRYKAKEKLELTSDDESTMTTVTENDPADPSEHTIDLDDYIKVHQREADEQREKLLIEKMQEEQDLVDLTKQEGNIKAQKMQKEQDLEKLMEELKWRQEYKEDAQHRLNNLMEQEATIKAEVMQAEKLLEVPKSLGAMDRLIAWNANNMENMKAGYDDNMKKMSTQMNDMSNDIKTSTDNMKTKIDEMSNDVKKSAEKMKTEVNDFFTNKLPNFFKI